VRPREVPESPEDAELEDGNPILLGCFAAALAVGGWVATDATHGLLRIVCGVVTVAATGVAIYLFVLLVITVVGGRAMDSFARGRLNPTTKRIMSFIWIAVVPVLCIGWAVTRLLSGYDADEWLWSGAAVAAASAVILLAVRRWSR
jgi:hypothetical protein